MAKLTLQVGGVILFVVFSFIVGCSNQNVVEPRVVSEKDVTDVPICGQDTSDPGGIARVFSLSICWTDQGKNQLSIYLTLPRSGKVELTIYAQSGEETRKLVNESKEPGYHVIEWNLHDSRGVKVYPGIYGVMLETGEFRCTRWFEVE